MSTSFSATATSQAIDTFSRLLISTSLQTGAEAKALRQLSPEQFDCLVSIAHSNHVVMRGMEVYRALMDSVGDPERAQVATDILAAEQARIEHALQYMDRICKGFAEAGLDITIVKTLDHWPDFGSDIDLYTNSDPAVVCDLMQKRFGATISERSWGDRLAGKWNFEIPDLPESVEIHMCRLGQTGEHLALAKNIPARSRTLQYGNYSFPVAHASDRIIISTLQRMYRHFYFRLCDILDSAALVRSGAVDFEDLRRTAQASGVWEGTATYLVLVSDYVLRYSGREITLPQFVRDAARFDGNVMYTGGDFIRVPIMPQAAQLYGSQLFGTLRKGEMHSSARLSLLPWLATAAAIGYKLTGSDKGIW